MTVKVYNKLVRDKIPEIIEANGERAIIRQLNGREFKRALLEKLVEEAKELLESDGSLEERADVAEVLAALDQLSGWTTQDVVEVQGVKNKTRGAFGRRLYLEETTDRAE